MTMLLDILFVHPNASDKIYQSLGKDHSAIEPPIWAAMLANHCRSKGYGVSILDCEAERLDYNSSVKAIEDSEMKDGSSINNLPYLSFLEGNFGIEARENVEGMLKIKIKRNLFTNQIKTQIKQRN